jgi:hypothetical protein
MKKEDIGTLSQLLTNVKDALNELETAIKKKDYEKINATRRKILDFQLQIDRKL